MISVLKSFLEDKKIIVMSWICFITSIVVMFRTPDNWELITLLLAFSFFPNLMKEFITKKYSLQKEVKNEGDK